jgi:hypothetical protein
MARYQYKMLERRSGPAPVSRRPEYLTRIPGANTVYDLRRYR